MNGKSNTSGEGQIDPTGEVSIIGEEDTMKSAVSEIDSVTRTADVYTTLPKIINNLKVEIDPKHFVSMTS